MNERQVKFSQWRIACIIVAFWSPETNDLKPFTSLDLVGSSQ